LGIFWSTWAAICCAALIAMSARAEVVTDLAPFTRDSARPEGLVPEGPIDGRAPALLKRALRRFPSVTTLSLYSEGGSTYAALPKAYDVRDAGQKTTIPAGGACASACSSVFFAGVERNAGSRSVWGRARSLRRGTA